MTKTQTGVLGGSDCNQTFVVHLLSDWFLPCVCVCRPRVDHYFPDLHHLKFEIEEGTTPDGRAVRFGYDRLEFRDFSWRGYAQMSPIQVGRPETRTGLRLQHLSEIC